MTRLLKDWPADVALILEQEGIDKFYASAASAGCVHVMTVASALSDRCLGLGLATPTTPMEVEDATLTGGMEVIPYACLIHLAVATADTATLADAPGHLLPAQPITKYVGKYYLYARPALPALTHYICYHRYFRIVLSTPWAGDLLAYLLSLAPAEERLKAAPDVAAAMVKLKSGDSLWQKPMFRSFIEDQERGAVKSHRGWADNIFALDEIFVPGTLKTLSGFAAAGKPIILTTSSDDTTNPPPMQRWYAEHIQGAQLLHRPAGYGHMHFVVPLAATQLWKAMLGDKAAVASGAKHVATDKPTKHEPVAKAVGVDHSGVTVRVSVRGAGGSDDEAKLHPMTDAHFISDMYLLDERGAVIDGVKSFDSASASGGAVAAADFLVKTGLLGASSVTPVEYCNKHGLWVGPTLSVNELLRQQSDTKEEI